MRYSVEFEPSDWLEDPDHIDRFNIACAFRASWLENRMQCALEDAWDDHKVDWDSFDSDMQYLTDELSCLIIKAHVIYDDHPYAAKAVFFRGGRRRQTVEELSWPKYGDWQTRQLISTIGNSEGKMK